MRAAVLSLLLWCLAAAAGGAAARAGTVLFDAAHAQTAGNADWVLDQDNGVPVRFPTPPASGITANTPETYWTGATSAWGVALVKLGHAVETLPPGGRLSYGDPTNPQDLANYQVLVIPEPNVRFTAAERTAVVRFVQDGGGLFMVPNHAGSDRNNDGADPVAIFNQLFSDNGVAVNPFGVTINANTLSLTSPHYDPDPADPLTNGPVGPVTQLKYSAGATLSLSVTANPTVRAAFWTTANQSPVNVMAAWGRFGRGRFAVVGDSSPQDDGTGAPGDNLFFGWTDLAPNHSNLHLNGTLWLLAAGTDPAIPPPNDHFANATVLDPASTAPVTGTTLGATREPGEPEHAGDPTGTASAWWTVTPAANGTATVSATGNGFLPTLAAYLGDSVNALGNLAFASPGTASATLSFPVTAGVPVRLAVEGPEGTAGPVSLVCTLPQPPPPANDLFANATVVSFAGDTTTLSGTNVRATAETGEPAHASTGVAIRSVWWTWTPAANATATLSTAGSGFDTRLAVYTGAAVNALSLAASNNDANGTPQSLVSFNAIAGTPYRIAVDGVAGASGSVSLNFTLSAPAARPANDDFANAAPLAGTVLTATANTVTATAETGEPAHFTTARHSVWWTWTAPESGTVQVDTIGSNFNTTLAVYTGDSLGTLSRLFNDDNNGGSNTSKLFFRAVEGTTYRLVVDGFSSTSVGNAVLHLAPGTAPAPANDAFANALTLTGANPSTVGDTTFATRETAEPSHAANLGGGSLWWTFTPTANGTATARTTGSDFDTLLAVYTGSDLAALTPVAANDDDGTLTTSRTSFPVTAGVAYRVAVDGRDGAYGRVSLALTVPFPPPANDAFANAVSLGNGPTATGAADTSGATKEPGEPAHDGRGGTRSAWWTWTAPATGPVRVDTDGSSFDTVLAVYTGGAVNALTRLASDDDSGVGVCSQLVFPATAGVVYRLAVDGFGSTSSGSVSLRLARLPVARITPAAAANAPAERGSVAGAFTVTLEPVPAAAVSVNVVLTGTAQRGTDYLASPAPDTAGTVALAVPANAASATLTVTPRADDDPAEGPETILATLAAPVLAPTTSHGVDPANQAAALAVADDSPYPAAWAARLRAAGITGPGAAPGADPGNRGVPNLLRWSFDLDPADPAVAGLPVPGVGTFPDPAEEDLPRAFLTLTFTRRTDVATAGRLLYAVEETADLLAGTVAWFANTAVPVNVTPGPTADTERVTYRAARPLASAPRGFLRLRVTTPAP